MDTLLDELLECVRSHDADSRILGNLRAGDIANLLVFLSEKWDERDRAVNDYLDCQQIIQCMKEDRDSACAKLAKAEAACLDHVQVAAPAALGANVLQYAPAGPIGLTVPQREEVLRELGELAALRARNAKLEAVIEAARSCVDTVPHLSEPQWERNLRRALAALDEDPWLDAPLADEERAAVDRVRPEGNVPWDIDEEPKS